MIARDPRLILCGNEIKRMTYNYVNFTYSFTSSSSKAASGSGNGPDIFEMLKLKCNDISLQPDNLMHKYIHLLSSLLLPNMPEHGVWNILTLASEHILFVLHAVEAADDLNVFALCDVYTVHTHINPA